MNAAIASRKIEWIHIAVILAMFAASGLCWNSAPDRVPMHWNVKGEVDGWGGRLEGLFLLPAISLGIYALLRFIPLLDPGRENYKQFAMPYMIIRCGITGLMIVIHAAILAWVLDYRIDMGLVVGGSVGLFFVVLGNIMGKIRPNWFVGVRTPWTLSSKLSWAKTHRVGGWLFIVMGIGIAATAIIRSNWAVIVLLTGSFVGIAALIAYSYVVWRKDPDRIPPAATLPAPDENDEPA